MPESQVCNFIEKETLAQVYSCEFCEICKSTFSYRTPTLAYSGLTVTLCLKYLFLFELIFQAEYVCWASGKINLSYEETENQNQKQLLSVVF